MNDSGTTHPAADSGLVSVPSRFSVRDTINHLVTIVTSKGLTIFARIDHAANAVAAGLPLRPTELLIFGNPKAGTPLMQDRQTAALDLPVKAVAWEDADGRTWLTYNHALWVARRHGLGDSSAQAVDALQAGLAAVTAAAASSAA